jgi:hypothetical protein
MSQRIDTRQTYPAVVAELGLDVRCAVALPEKSDQSACLCQGPGSQTHQFVCALMKESPYCGVIRRQCQRIISCAHQPDHGLVLGLEREDIVLELLPRLLERRMLVAEDVREPRVERLGRVRARVEAALGELLAVDVAAVEGIERVHADQQLEN